MCPKWKHYSSSVENFLLNLQVETPKFFFELPLIGFPLLLRQVILLPFGRSAQRHKINSAVTNCEQEVFSGARLMQMQFDLNIVT